jgi:hypothetical protein
MRLSLPLFFLKLTNLDKQNSECGSGLSICRLVASRPVTLRVLITTFSGRARGGSDSDIWSLMLPPTIQLVHPGSSRVHTQFSKTLVESRRSHHRLRFNEDVVNGPPSSNRLRCLCYVLKLEPEGKKSRQLKS